MKNKQMHTNIQLINNEEVLLKNDELARNIIYAANWVNVKLKSGKEIFYPNVRISKVTRELK